jgi:hypothetical protein
MAVLGNWVLTPPLRPLRGPNKQLLQGLGEFGRVETFVGSKFLTRNQGGPGVTGTSGVATGTPSTPTATQSSESYTCSRGDTGEECCQRAPNPPLHWCSGEFPYFRCYNDKNQWCCTDGTVCDEEDCCELFVCAP